MEEYKDFMVPPYAEYITKFFDNPNKPTIDYSYDWPHDTGIVETISAWIPTKFIRPSFIVKTNRYSKRYPNKIIWEYSDFEVSELRNILYWFIRTNNDNNYKPITGDITQKTKQNILAPILIIKEYKELTEPVIRYVNELSS
jgi:hypothetical protein